jgi:acetyltransferase-like isoleucine patch superfamily enzyme
MIFLLVVLVHTVGRLLPLTQIVPIVIYNSPTILLVDVNRHIAAARRTNPSIIFDAVVSPDQQRIAFSMSDNRRINIYVGGLYDKDYQRVTTETFGGDSPAWSPDSHQIAFVGLEPDNKRGVFAFFRLHANLSLVTANHRFIAQRKTKTGPFALYRLVKWDIGTIEAFFEANLILSDSNPKFNFNEPGAPVYTHARFLPASIMRSTHIDHSLICDGCVIEKATIVHSIIGIRSFIDADTVLKEVILMGADENQPERPDLPRIGIGRGCNIQKAIIDKNARIGDNVVISPQGKDEEMNGEGFYIRDGIVVIPKNSVIASGTRI